MLINNQKQYNWIWKKLYNEIQIIENYKNGNINVLEYIRAIKNIK